LLCIFVRNISRNISSDLKMKLFKRKLTDAETSDFYYEPETSFLVVEFRVSETEKSQMIKSEVRNLYIRFFVCPF
jgi:GH15 family glucan-1,4-alpha-glucosidase